jgi:hypothetical protein
VDQLLADSRVDVRLLVQLADRPEDFGKVDVDAPQAGTARADRAGAVAGQPVGAHGAVFRQRPA